MGATLLGDRLPHVLYGGDYNPEQWPEEVWQEDMALMHEAGVNLVSLGIFSWAWLEPRPGEFDFGWLDRVMDLLHANGVAVDLATGTASPPPWLSRLHPESLPVLEDGTRVWPGARQHFCPSSPAYREYALQLVAALAARYAGHPGLVMWHVGNEFACHNPACYCDISAAAFRAWLGRRYGTLDALNAAWGTAFWSQRYSDWEEIIPPRRTASFGNPTQALDFARFSSDAHLECFEAERDLLRRHAPRVPITTNFMGFHRPLDYWRWAEREDLVSYDSYPDPSDPLAPLNAAMSHDLARSLAGGRPWVLMEQTSSRVNWRQRNVAKRPGQMRLWSYQAMAHGADGILFFQWRASKAGAEKFHSAMVPHVPPARSRTWDEVAELGAELRRLDAIAGSRVEAEVAIVFGWESWWALELPSKPSGDLRLMEQIGAWYGALRELGLTVDFAPPGADLSGYRVVVAPCLYLVDDAAVESLRDYAGQGGTLLMSFFSGIVDRNDHIRLGGYPAPFRDLLGIFVEDFRPLAEGETARVRFGDGETADATLWSEIVHADDAETLAWYASGELAGRPAITRRGGSGAAYYVSTALGWAGLRKLLQGACQEAGARPVLGVPPGVEAVRRCAGEQSFLFLLNHNQEAVELRVPERCRDLLAGRPIENSRLQLEAFGVALLADS